MRIITYIFLILILLIGITFACLNSEPVILNYYIGKHSLPLSLLLVMTFAIGCIIGLCVSGFIYIKQKAKIFHLQNRLKLTEKELSNLRTIPLKDNR